MTRYRAYLFDLDGTLVDTAPDIHRALNVALDEHGFPTVHEAHTRHWIGHGARALVSQALASLEIAQPDTATLDAVHEHFLDYYVLHIADHSRPYPGAREALQTLRLRGAKLAVVTNKITTLSLSLLDTLGLSEHFASIVCGDTTEHPKPHPSPVHYACEQLGVAADHEVLFVGDSRTDVEAARNAGIPVWCVRDGYNHGVRPEDLGADAIIDSLMALV